MKELQKIKELDARYFMNTFGPRFPVAFDSGEGCTLFDTEGKPYIDFFAGIAVNVLEYAHRVSPRPCRNSAQGSYTPPTFLLYRAAGRARAGPRNPQLAPTAFSSPTRARRRTRRQQARAQILLRGEKRYEIITAKHSFHGRTLAALAATGQEKCHALSSPCRPPSDTCPTTTPRPWKPPSTRRPAPSCSSRYRAKAA